MGDTRCKHCGERIEQVPPYSEWTSRKVEWRHVGGREWCPTTVATPEEARRG